MTRGHFMQMKFPYLKGLAFATVLAGMFSASAAHAQGNFSTKPQLRVESGTHVGSIASMDTDSENRYLVTGNGDKTVRLWERSTGALLKVMRPPIGPATRGVVGAVAISPDGTTIAAGGNHCAWHQKTFCVLLFATASGRLVRTIGGLPNSVVHLAWSPDGTLLALGMSQTGGLRILRTKDWSELARDSAYRDFIDDIHFSGFGRLATASGDGSVRVYSIDLNGLALKIAKHVDQLTRPSGRPRAVRFSPDGKLLAVGQSRGAAFVTIHDPDTLDERYRASTNWDRDLGTSNLAWSRDGEMLYAGVSSTLLSPLFVRRWPNRGRGIPTDLPIGRDTGIEATVPLNDGSIAWTGNSAGMGVFNKDGGMAWAVRPQAANFLDTADFLRVSKDGTKVDFSPDAGAHRLNFDLSLRKLSNGESKEQGMRSPVTAGGSLNFYNQWRNTRGTLQLANRRLGFGAFEVVRSLSISPDTREFAVGTSGRIVNFDASGKQLWSVPSFAHYAVNHSADGRLIVAAVGDGSIRWYRRANGKLLATLFPSPDGRRWVLASPTGYYDASVGAEDLLGWHINRLPNQEADFFPVSRFRAHFYRPEIVAEIIATADDSKAIALAAAPVVGGTQPVANPKPAPIVNAEPVKPEPPRPVAPVVSIPVAPPQPKPDAPIVVAPIKPQLPDITVAIKPQPQAPPVPVAGPNDKPSPPKPAADPVQTTLNPDDEAGGPTTVEAAQTVVDLSSLLPPVITILSPSPGATVKSATVSVKYIVRTTSDAPITNVRARVNGLSSASRGIPSANTVEEKEIVVTLPSGESEILLFAENRNGTSAPATLKIKLDAPPPAPVDSRPVLYVLSVGVSNYVDPEIRLNLAAKDAKDFIATMLRQKGRLYRDVIVRGLTDRDATAANVIEGFNWLQKSVTDKDVGMAFIAGHGISDDRGRYYFLPANVNVDRLESTSVPFSEIRTKLGNLQGKGLLFVDTCQSGDVMGGRRGFSNDVNGILNELSSPEYGLVVLASSTGKQVSLEDQSWGNGAFTKALVEGLSGQADLKHRGRITHKMLDFYVSDRVDELTKGQQTPVNPSPMGVPDYVIAVTVP